MYDSTISAQDMDFKLTNFESIRKQFSECI